MVFKWLPRLRLKPCLEVILGNCILAFGLYHIHSKTNVTEGGVLGLTLLLDYLFDISPAYSGFVLDALCYFIGWKVLGKDFLGYSFVAALAFSVCYRICELFPPLWPDLVRYPFMAAVSGAVFVGVGVGISVRAGGASGGDDALAMALTTLTRIPIERLYLASDLIVLALSLVYIPLSRLMWSLLTVVLSGQIIGWFQRIPVQKERVHEH